MLFEDNF
ncbi:044ed75d-e584-4934-8487-82a2047a18af [Thermothielavioides terrestris]|nr:044ed75d-e584-4934-8487-82a2047a18af [Thermothielavioides terrestris]